MVSRQNSKDNDGYDSSDLFKEAEDFIKDKMNNILGLGYACGIATKERCQQEIEKNFGSNDEDDDGILEDPNRLSWRMDPRESESDWVLVVKDGQRSHIYHVHKTTLVYGDRKSGFFLKLFEKIYEDGNPNQRNVTEVPLDAYTAMFVPLLLDYIYEDKLDLNATIAPGLRRIANQFDVRPLYALVSSFIQQDLSEKTVAIYLEQAQLSDDNELSDIALLSAVQSFNLVPEEELGKIPPAVFQKLVSDQNLNISSPEMLSQKIAAYFRVRAHDIDEETFFFLTHANILPKIHPCEAIYFLDFGSKNFMTALEDETGGGYESSLLRRCVSAAGEEWNKYLPAIEHDIKKKTGNAVETGPRLFGNRAELDEIALSYLDLPDHMKVEVLQESLLRASQCTRGRAARSQSLDPRPRGVRDSSPVDFSRFKEENKKKTRFAKPPKHESSSREYRGDTPSRREGSEKRNGVRKVKKNKVPTM